MFILKPKKTSKQVKTASSLVSLVGLDSFIAFIVHRALRRLSIVPKHRRIYTGIGGGATSNQMILGPIMELCPGLTCHLSTTISAFYSTHPRVFGPYADIVFRSILFQARGFRLNNEGSFIAFDVLHDIELLKAVNRGNTTWN